MVYTINTSYFAKSCELENTVSISRSTPTFYKGKVFKSIAPTYDILAEYKETGDEVTFEMRYREEILAHLDPEFVADMLDGMTILCYEKSGKFCHRHILIEWLEEHLGEENIRSNEL